MFPLHNWHRNSSMTSMCLDVGIRCCLPVVRDSCFWITSQKLKALHQDTKGDRSPKLDKRMPSKDSDALNSSNPRRFLDLPMWPKITAHFLKSYAMSPNPPDFVLVPSLTPFDPLPPTPSTSVGASFAGSWANISWLLENLDCGLKHNIGRKKHALATILWVTAWPVLNFPDLLQLHVLHPFAHRTKQEKEH